MRCLILMIIFLISSTVYADSSNDIGEKLIPVYFDTDKHKIKESELEKIKANADTIIKNNLKVIVVGNADRRGDRPYNINLGSRRAVSVALALVDNGVKESQIILVSYGEEKPISFDLLSNRRVDIVSINPIKEVVLYQNKNRISLHGGIAPNGLNNLILKPDHAKFEQHYGPVFGLGYSRLVSDRISLGITGFTNKSGFLNIGLDF